MKASSLSEQPLKSGTERSRSTRAAATAPSLASLGDTPPRRVDLRDEGRTHAVSELAFVVAVEDDDVRAPTGDEGADAAAPPEGVRGVDRRGDDRLMGREPAEGDAQCDRGGHALERRCPGIVVRRERDRNSRR